MSAFSMIPENTGKQPGESFRLSIAIPLHNEQDVIPELLQRLRVVLASIDGGPHEVIFVDDGSTDNTALMLEEAAFRDPRFTVVSLSRNFGHQAALAAALDYVSGDAVVLMDADLQDRPEAIPQFVEKFWQGYDVVYAQRVRRKEALWLRFCYKAFYRLLNCVSDLRLSLDSGDFGLMSARVVNELRRLQEHHRYLRGLRSWVGFRQVGIEVERDARFAGETKYSLPRLIRLASDGLLAFSTVPIRAAALFGMLAMIASVLLSIYTVFTKFVVHHAPPGYTTLVILITFLSGVHLIFLSIIGEYLGRVYEEVKARPVYIVGRVTRRRQRWVDYSSDRAHAESTASR